MINPDHRILARFIILLLLTMPLAGCTSTPTTPVPRNYCRAGSGPCADIRIESVPAGAGIYIDHTWMAITNETIQLKEGSYTLELINPGYQKYYENFSANLSTVKIIQVNLVPVTTGTTPTKPQTPIQPVTSVLSILIMVIIVCQRRFKDNIAQDDEDDQEKTGKY